MLATFIIFIIAIVALVIFRFKEIRTQINDAEEMYRKIHNIQEEG